MTNSVWLVMLLRCKTCRRPIARLLQSETMDRRWWNVRGLAQPCHCGRADLRGLPDPEVFAERIDREWRRQHYPVVLRGAEPVKAPFTVYA